MIDIFAIANMRSDVINTHAVCDFLVKKNIKPELWGDIFIRSRGYTPKDVCKIDKDSDELLEDIISRANYLQYSNIAIEPLLLEERILLQTYKDAEGTTQHIYATISPFITEAELQNTPACHGILAETYESEDTTSYDAAYAFAQDTYAYIDANISYEQMLGEMRILIDDVWIQDKINLKRVLKLSLTKVSARKLLAKVIADMTQGQRELIQDFVTVVAGSNRTLEVALCDL